MRQSKARGHPSSQRFTGNMGALDLQRVEKADEVIDIGRNVHHPVGLVGPAVAEHIDGIGAEQITMRTEIADIGLRMSAGAVQEDECRAVRVSARQVPGADAACVDPVLTEADAAQVGPHA